MLRRRSRKGRAATCALLALGMTVAVGVRAAHAYLVIDWLSCHAEVVSNGEGRIRFSGREICALIDVAPFGRICRPEPVAPHL